MSSEDEELAARGESPASHRGGRCARMARRDDREYREYLRKEQRSSTPGSPTRHPRWGGGGMQRRPNAAGLSPRAAKERPLQEPRQDPPVDELERRPARAVVPAAEHGDLVGNGALAELPDEILGEIDRERQVVARVNEQCLPIAHPIEI